MKRKEIWLIILFIILTATAVGIIIYNNTDTVKLKNQLDLGQKYLSEMNYEEAAVAFNQAIEIDPRSADAYLGLADAYLGLGDEEAALVALEAGYEATGDERLKERIDELKAAINSESEGAGDSKDVSEVAKNDEEIVKRIDEIIEFIKDETTIGHEGHGGEYHLLTYDQIEAAYRPLAEELEIYIEQMQGELSGRVYLNLARLYCHLGEMGKCLEVRHKGYEATRMEDLKPERQLGPSGWERDEYGRTVIFEDGDTCIYEDSDRPVYFVDGEYEYDSLGRISKVHGDSTDPNVIPVEISYEYQGDNSVFVTADYNHGALISTYTLIYNEYGVITEQIKSQ